jgi:tRNA-specific 2-thiouridylase
MERNSMNERVKIAVGLSGGVDSSVAAALLQKQGYDVVGLTMAIYDGSIPIEASEKHACFGPGEEADIENAASVCKTLDIPFHVIDLKKEYQSHVIDYFRQEYLSGRTPNPCVKCNQQLKFGFLLEKAKISGVDFSFFATGHYARIEKSGDHYLLKRAADLTKDQSYFLYGLTSGQLSRIRFPLGDYTKPQVREMAREFGLETAEHPESQDFIDGGDYAVLFDKKDVPQGNIIDEKGNVLGKHRGIIHYTPGQRRGLGIAADRPLYVAKIDAENNTLVVSDRENLFSDGLIATGFYPNAANQFDSPCPVMAKIRLNSTPVKATVFPLENHKTRIMFDEPQMAVAPGQSVVLYTDDTVFGGGIIEKAL